MRATRRSRWGTLGGLACSTPKCNRWLTIDIQKEAELELCNTPSRRGKRGSTFLPETATRRVTPYFSFRSALMPRHQCPSSDELRAFLRGSLPEPAVQSISRHLSACLGCSTTVREALEQDAALRHEDVSTPARRLPESEAHDDGPSQKEFASSSIIGAELSERRLPGQVPCEELFLGRGRLGGYELLGRLGHGGMGEVYKARHTRLKRVVAIKILRDAQSHSTEALRRFQREMEAVGRLEHPQIVNAYDAGEASGQHFLVMEYVEGRNWDAIVRCCGPLPIAVACELVRQAAVGLQHAHQQGFVHRDVKPANLMLNIKGEVKILDLGLARLMGEQGEGITVFSPGRVLGTLDYMSPEQAEDGQLIDQRADIYSLGATLYKLLTGTPPFASGKYATTLQKVAALASEPIPPLADHCPHAPAALADAVDRMLSKNPDDRYADMVEVATALEPFCCGADLRAVLEHAERVETDPDQSQWADCQATWKDYVAGPTKRAAKQAVFPGTSLRASVVPERNAERSGILPGAIAIGFVIAASAWMGIHPPKEINATRPELATTGQVRSSTQPKMARLELTRNETPDFLQVLDFSKGNQSGLLSQETEWFDGDVFGHPGGLLRFLRGGTSWLETEFEYSPKPNGGGERVNLVVEHHSSRMDEVGTGYSPVAILLNGQEIWRGSPPDRATSPSIWDRMEFDISRNLRSGVNKLRWEHLSGAKTHYWLKRVQVIRGRADTVIPAGAID